MGPRLSKGRSENFFLRAVSRDILLIFIWEPMIDEYTAWQEQEDAGEVGI